MLESVINLARPRGWRAVSLSVEDRNRAVELYRAVGFRTVRHTESSDTILPELRS